MTSPLTVIEQITYLMFIKILDDNELRKEANAAAFDMPVVDPIFDKDHQNCRWSNFRHYDANAMFSNITDKVFPFIKNDLNAGKDTAFARYMKDALFLVPTARVLVKVVDALDSLDLNNKDIMGDVYEYLLSQIAQSGTNGQFRTPRHIIKMMVELMQPTLEDTICDPAMGSARFIKVHSFEFALLSFDLLEQWVFAEEDEMREKRKNLLQARAVFLKQNSSGADATGLQAFKEAFADYESKNSEQIAAKLLYGITRNTGFETDKSQVGDCFINTCCEWAGRQSDDLCGLDSHRISAGEKVRQLVDRSVLKAAFEEVGL